MTTPRGTTELVEAQATPETRVNAMVRRTEQGASYYIVKDKDLAAPPGSPADGDAYIVAAAPTGAWSGWAGRIAWYSSGWDSIVPIEGTRAEVQDEDIAYRYDGVTWASAASTGYTPGGTDVALADGGTGASLADPNADRILFWDDSAGAMTWLEPSGAPFVSGTKLHVRESIIVACSDETTAITTGNGKVTFRMPYAFTLEGVRASVGTAPTGSTIIIDINEAGATILSTKLSIDASEKTSTTAASAAVISDTALADDAEMTIDFDQVGSTITGAGLKVALLGYRP